MCPYLIFLSFISEHFFKLLCVSPAGASRSHEEPRRERQWGAAVTRAELKQCSRRAARLSVNIQNQILVFGWSRSFWFSLWSHCYFHYYSADLCLYWLLSNSNLFVVWIRCSTHFSSLLRRQGSGWHALNMYETLIISLNMQHWLEAVNTMNCLVKVQFDPKPQWEEWKTCDERDPAELEILVDPCAPLYEPVPLWPTIQNRSFPF